MNLFQVLPDRNNDKRTRRRQSSRRTQSFVPRGSDSFQVHRVQGVDWVEGDGYS